MLYMDSSSYPGESWQTVSYTLTGAEASALNAARDAGKRVYVVIDLNAEGLPSVRFAVAGGI